MARENINECIVLTNLYYAVEDNTWVRVNDDGTVTIGMTDIAQSLAGPILHARPKKVGVSGKKGRPIATVESGKWVGPVKSPMSGEILEVNESLESDAQIVNRSPYRDGWILKMKPDNMEADLQEMVTGEAAVEAYRAKIQTDGVTCKHIEGTDEYND